MSDSPSSASSAVGPIGVWCSTDRLPAGEAAELAGEIESLGYSTLWVPEVTGRDPFTHLAFLASQTSTLGLATGIANIHHRHPGAMKQAAATLAEQSGGRFLCAIGVSHAPVVEGIRGLDYSRPASTLRTYLEAMAASPYTAVQPERPPPILVGALGPTMIRLARDLTDGVHPYWTTPEHTASARDLLGPDKLLCVEQKVVLTDDGDEARTTAARALSLYWNLPNYRNNWLRLGFTDDEIDSGAPRLLDALVAWGDPERIRSRIDEHLAAGADHVCIQPMARHHAGSTDRTALAALAPGR